MTGAVAEFVVSNVDYSGRVPASDAVQAAIARARRVRLKAGRVRLAPRGLVIDGPKALSGAGDVSVLVAAPTLPFPDNRVLTAASQLASRRTFSGAIAAGQRVFEVSSTKGLKPGQLVFLKLGVDPFDDTQAHVKYFAKVSNVAGGAVEFDEAVGEAVNGTSHELFVVTNYATGVEIGDLALDYDPSTLVDQMIVFQYVSDARVRRVTSIANTGAVVEVRDSERVSVADIVSHNAVKQHASAGRVVAGWGMRGCEFRNIFARNVEGAAVFLESQCRGVLISNLHLEASCSIEFGTALVHVVGGCRGIRIENYHFRSPVPGVLALYTGQAAQVTTKDVYLWSQPKSFPLSGHEGILVYQGKSYSRHGQYSQRIALRPAWYGATFELPAGQYKRVRIHANATVGIERILVLTQAGNRGVDVTAYLRAGQSVEMPEALTRVGSDYPLSDEAAKKITITTSETLPAWATLTVAIDYIAEEDGRRDA